MQNLVQGQKWFGGSNLYFIVKCYCQQFNRAGKFAKYIKFLAPSWQKERGIFVTFEEVYYYYTPKSPGNTNYLQVTCVQVELERTWKPITSLRPWIVLIQIVTHSSLNCL